MGRIHPKATHDREESAATDEIKPFAKGSHKKDGNSWMGTKSLSDVHSFDELVKICEQSLFRLKPSIMKAGLKKFEGIFDGGQDTNSLFGESIIATQPAADTLRDLVATRLVGTVTRVMSKPNAENDTVRPMVKGEIEYATKIMGKISDGAWSFESVLPACLRNEVAAVISMKWKR